tara:strand:+ start:1010 stop:1240 length:231 start_codon:yes stop_codon:yes gene_type:complete
MTELKNKDHLKFINAKNLLQKQSDKTQTLIGIELQKENSEDVTTNISNLFIALSNINTAINLINTILIEKPNEKEK